MFPNWNLTLASYHCDNSDFTTLALATSIPSCAFFLGVLMVWNLGIFMNFKAPGPQSTPIQPVFFTIEPFHWWLVWERDHRFLRFTIMMRRAIISLEHRWAPQTKFLPLQPQRNALIFGRGEGSGSSFRKTNLDAWKKLKCILFPKKETRFKIDIVDFTFLFCRYSTTPQGTLCIWCKAIHISW